MANNDFGSVANSNQYFKEVQNEPGIVTQYDKSIWKNAKCLEPGCSLTFATKNILMEHLIELHEFAFEVEECEVTSWQEFQAWKDSLEEKEKQNYVLCSRKYDEATNQTLSLTFACQGISKTKSECGKNASQIEHACTSHIEATEVNQSLILIEWIKNHYGHTCIIYSDLNTERDTDMDDGKELKEVAQSNMITKKEMKNDINKCTVRTKKIDRDDGIFSLDLWVQECDGHQDNPVIFYKPSNYAMEGFPTDGFCLIVMTNFQADMLLKYPDIIAIDSTYGLEDCDFELTTLLIIDKKGELFPAAFMFTNSDEKSTSTLFFNQIKEKVGSISAQIFISEMTGKFYDSWCESMGPISNWVFCSCHLEHIWKLNLLNIKSRDKRIWVYETLKELQLTSDEEKFINFLDSAINELLNDKDTYAFGDAFQNSYIDCVRQWVYCYRKNLGLEADIYLDSMRKMVKCQGGKKTFRKHNEIVGEVLKYVRNKTVACIVEEAEGDLKQEINQNHDRSVQNVFHVTKCLEVMWRLKKEGTEGYYQSVEKLSNSKCCDVTCCECDVCVHMYSCSCPAYFINSNICEHIHYIATNYKNIRNRTEKRVVKMDEDLDFANEHIPEIPLSSIVNETIKKLQSVDFDSLPDEITSQILPYLVTVNNLLSFDQNVECNNDLSEARNPS